MTNSTKKDIAAYDAAKLKWDGTSVSNMLKVLTKATSRMAVMKSATAAACVMHAIDHGNATPMTRFITACGEGERNDAIVKWAVDFGPFKWERDNDLKTNVFKMDTEKRTLLQERGADYAKELLALPYWTYVPQKEVPAFNLIAVLKTAVGRAHKAMKDDARKAKSDFTGLADVEELLARLAPTKAA